MPPKFQRRQDWGKIYTATQWKECLFNCIFFYVLCILILEGLILNKTKILVGLLMTVNEDQTCSWVDFLFLKCTMPPWFQVVMYVVKIMTQSAVQNLDFCPQKSRVQLQPSKLLWELNFYPSHSFVGAEPSTDSQKLRPMN